MIFIDLNPNLPMSLIPFRDNECLLFAQKHCACIEFVLGEREPGSGLTRRHGFNISQLLHYRVEANSAAGNNAPPEKLIIAFTTADVTLLGWRLDRVAERLRDGDLLAVRTLPPRYLSVVGSVQSVSNPDPTKCLVVDISIEPVTSV